MNTRAKEQNKVKEEIFFLEKNIKIHENSLNRIKQNKEDDFTKTQIQKLNEQILDKKKQITEKENYLIKLDSGELDELLKLKIKESTKISDEKRKITNEKKKEEQEYNKQQAKISKDYYKKQLSSDKLNKDWYYNSAYKHYKKTDENLPDYLIQKLSQMPYNKGYVFKGVYYFGRKEEPCSSYDFSFNENFHGKRYNHVWDKNCIYKYELNNNKKPILIEKKNKKNIPIPFERQNKEKILNQPSLKNKEKILNQPSLKNKEKTLTNNLHKVVYNSRPRLLINIKK